MILAAGLLVLAGLGLFLAGVMTGTTVFYWACVAVCLVAAVLLFGARQRITRAETALQAAAGGKRVEPATGRTSSGTAAGTETSGAAGAGAGTGTAVVPATTAPGEPPATSPAEVRPEDVADPPVEEVEVTDLLLIVDLKDEVLVVDEHPRYHLAGCRFLAGRTAIPLPMDEARTDGFTPCALCAPDRHLADRERMRRAGTDR